MNIVTRRTISLLVFILLSILCTSGPYLYGQSNNRIHLHDHDIFLNGGNVAWIDFARDIGPGTTRLDLFEEMFREMHEHGGNSFRLWLHTNGAGTPEFSGSGSDAVVVGPGVGAIEDLRAILDLAYFYDIGLKLCLWSFDMLHTNQYGSAITSRNRVLLTDTTRLQAYIENALIPMVDSLKGHPAILAWEIFNEPEGMSTQFGWTLSADRVTMAEIQRFVNRTSGAIRRTDPDVLITNGSWSFRASSDVVPSGASGSFYNFYRDDRLIEAGGDSLGYLDFYSVHYYEHFGISQSPFHTDAIFWQLDKPIVIAEFFLYDTYDQQADFIYGVPWGEAYTRLFDRGYAGALGWQWFDNWTNRQPEWQNWPRILENIQTMWNLHQEDVELKLPGIRISFSAFPEGIEAGSLSTLLWSVRGALTVTIDGETVEHEGSLDVFPEETTTYTLIAYDDEGGIEEAEVTITVLDPSLVNRALTKPIFASSIENSGHPAHYANDGNLNTRWSSIYQNNQWIYIDLGASYDVHQVILDWEVAYGESYDIDVSFDAVNWQTVFEERSGDGSIDSIYFESPVPARFIRMNGLVRGTQWGFSLWEFEAYGLYSDQQPPQISIISPIENAFLEAGVSFIIEMNVLAGTNEILQVDFYIDDEPAGSSSEEPYMYTWELPEEGTYNVYAIVGDGVFDIQSVPREILISPEAESIRFEAEHSIRTGNTTVMSDTAASNGSFVRMQDASGSSLTWDNIPINDTGNYGLRIGFRLPYDDPKGQYVDVNDGRIGEVMFTGPLNQWLTHTININLAGGTNTISITGNWGWMDFDYIEIRGQNLPTVGVDDRDDVVLTYDLKQNYPNPFNPSTVISYSVGSYTHVTLEVFDIMGRKVAALVDELLQPGSYEVTFDASRLASGLYFYRITANDLSSGSGQLFTKTKRLILVR
jgi:hypothetical protein